MAIRKVSIFILVIAFHLVVLGVVYVSTREAGDAQEEELSDKGSEANSLVSSNADSSENKVSPPVSSAVSANRQPTPSTETLIHEVKKGEFLGKIAAQYKVSSKIIMELNDIDNPNKLYLGQKLKIPAK